MFFILSKILVYLTMPFVWIIGLLIYAYFTKKPVRRKRLLITSTVLFLFFSNSIVFDEFMRGWEVNGQTYEDTGEYDVGIVLGGMVAYNQDLGRIVFKRGSDRIMQAVKLYKLGKIRKILISGDTGKLIEDGLDEAKRLRAYLISIGLESEDIIVETKSKNTHENAEFTVKLLRKKYPEYKRFLLITSAFHMRRAKACFKAEGLEVDHFTTDHFTGKRWFSVDRVLIPNIEVLTAWHVLTKEWTGYCVYGIMGYL